MPIHVLCLTPFYPSKPGDSSGCFVQEPITTLRQSGADVSVVAVRPFYKNSEIENSDAEWVRYCSFPGNFGLSSAGMFLYIRLLSKVRQLHRERPIDVIHAHGALPCGHAAALLARLLSIPFVVTVHGLDAFSTNQVKGWAGESCRRISRYVYRSAARVICVSGHVQEQVRAGASEAQCSIVYNGIDAALFFPSNSLGYLQPTILSVGNLIPTKGHELLIRSFAGLSKRYPMAVCRIVGVGPERKRLEAIAEQSGVGKTVHFLGLLSRSETAEAMRNCTIFALPSNYEALGCVYLEAMAAGKAVIACRGQGIDEIIHHGRNGLLLTTNEVDELSTALAWLLDNPESRERMGTEAAKTARGGFTLEYHAEELEQIYAEVAS